MNGRRVAAALLLALGSAACDADESVRPFEEGRTSSAKTLGYVSPELLDDLRSQTEAALARDAFRREERFKDAIDPGHLFRATDVGQSEIDHLLWSSRELYELGGQLFQLTFTRDQGFGGRDLPNLARFHTGRRGGPDARSCQSCHWRGGPAGGGDGADNAYLDGDGDSQASAIARNPIALAGDGLLEILAAEISTDLAGQRAELASRSAASNVAERGALSSKGLSFGFLTVRPDGTSDPADLAGIDADLAVRPFGWKGSFAHLRDAVEDALLVHHGMESEALVASGDAARIGPFGGTDPDGDAVRSEIREGQVSALTLFVAMQELPQVLMPPDSVTVEMWAEGRQRFEEIGCATCHVASLPLDGTVFSLPSREGAPPFEIDLALEGGEPRVARRADGSLRLDLFSDLKRHAMGAVLAEPRGDRATPADVFFTRPLWGIARSGPYMHDGRAATLEDAILLHGGEAQSARDAYVALPDLARGSIRVLLTSLTRKKRVVTQ